MIISSDEVVVLVVIVVDCVGVGVVNSDASPTITVSSTVSSTVADGESVFSCIIAIDDDDDDDGDDDDGWRDAMDVVGSSLTAIRSSTSTSSSDSSISFSMAVL